MVVLQMKHRFNRETTVLTPHTGCQSKLVLNPMFSYNHKQPRAQDRSKDLGSKVHEGNYPPLVWVTEVSYIGDWYDLAFVPFGEISFLVPI